MTNVPSSASPPLPNIHSLSISPYQSSGDYRYNGVFGPPVPGQNSGWTSPNKRGSRSGLPTNWYDPTGRDSQNPTPSFEPYRNQSPPALSPPSSTTSGPTTNSSHPYPYPGAYQHISDQPIGFSSMAISPSPPPVLGYGGISSTGSAPNLAGFNPGGLPQYGSQSLAAIQGRSSNGLWPRTTYAGVPMPDDDVIPTAIVIKNIPFAVPREQLLGVIESLGAPLPYAFNYHHDNGIFRGLAFANFRAPEEAASVVAALNGYDVQGRKLRVEYKKVLQPGEKDKIEREKALKRMRSIQFDPSPPVPGMDKMMPPPPLNIPPQHNNHMLGSRPSSATSAIPTPVSNGHMAVDQEHSPPHSASSATSENLPMNLDLNDPMALDIYSRVLVFKEDRMRDELAFSRSLTPTERRIVHLVANKLGLTSITKGNEGEVKYVVVTRESAPRPALTSSNSSSTAQSYLSPYGQTSNETSPSLRIKKSMPDLRGFNGPVVARDPARSLTPQRSSGNLRGEAANGREYVSMGASSGRRANGMGSGNFNGYFGSPVDGVPPVPPIPAGLNLHSSKGSISGSNGLTGSSPDNDPTNAAPMRNPRGPAGDARGFGNGLRTSNSGILRGGSAGSQGSSGMGMGRRLAEEDEEDEDDLLDSLRARESIEI